METQERYQTFSYMRNCLRVLLIADDVESSVFECYQRSSATITVTEGRQCDKPFVIAFATFVTAWPSAPAISSGSSDSRE